MKIIDKVLNKINDSRDNLRYKQLDISAEEIKRLKWAKGKKETALLGKDIEITDFFWYLHSLNELFIDESYKFTSTKENPIILDCGANIGLSVIYFKKLFPKTNITAFETDRQIAQTLKKNLDSFNFQDVKIIPKAVWAENTMLKFASDGGVG